MPCSERKNYDGRSSQNLKLQYFVLLNTSIMTELSCNYPHKMLYLPAVSHNENLYIKN